MIINQPKYSDSNSWVDEKNADDASKFKYTTEVMKISRNAETRNLVLFRLSIYLLILIWFLSET
jgi:hypothetical protein